MVEVKEILRLWVRGHSLHEVARMGGVDRKTVRRYVEAATSAGLTRVADVEIGEELIGAVVAAVRPDRPAGHGEAWETIAAHRSVIEEWLSKGLTVAKVHVLLDRRGVVVPYRTLHRFAVSECGFGRRRATVRVADGEPGGELQIDFGQLGLIPDPGSGRRRVVHALVFTACVSRHMFVYPTHRQTIGEVIAGCEAAWAFFGGVFRVVVPDNMKAIVDTAHPTEPRLTVEFVEYAQSRGFVVDPTRVRRPRDKPRVERAVGYVKVNFFAGEEFRDLADCRARAAHWSTHTAGLRIHGTTQQRPAQVFAEVELSRLLPAPAGAYDMPVWSEPKVHPDRHVEVAKALYSVPGELIGQRLRARADAATVKLYHRGQLIKVHPRVGPGERRTDPTDLPSELTAYALRDLDALRRRGAAHGEAIGRYVDAVLDHPLPWTKMRQVYRLFGLINRHGSDRVETCCVKALDAEAVSVGLIERMLTRDVDRQPPPPTLPAPAVAARFVRDPAEFALRREASS